MRVDKQQQETRHTDSNRDNAGHTTDELPTFDPFQTFIFQNIDKSLSPQDLKTFLCPNVERRPYVTVHMPSDKLGNTKGVAVVTAPKTYSRNVMEFNGTSSKSQRNKKFAVTKEDFPKHLKATKWVKTEDGSVHSCMEKTGIYNITTEREIKLTHCLVDSGAYLCHEYFTSEKDVDKVIERAFLSGIEKIVMKTKTVRTALKAQKLASLYPGILYFTAGVDCYEGGTWKGETTVSRLCDLLADPQCVALGEIGLVQPQDSVCKCSIETQMDIFTAQVSLACEMGKPLIIHENKMTDKVLNILDKFKPSLPPVLISTNDQELKTVQRYHKKGFYISITGFQWSIIQDDYKMNVWLRNFSRNLNKLRIVLASDSPHESPSFVELLDTNSYLQVPRSYLRDTHKSTCRNLTDYSSSLLIKYASCRNEPVSLQSVAELASGELETTCETLAAVTRKNAYKFFNFRESDKRSFRELDKKRIESKANYDENVIQNMKRTKSKTNYQENEIWTKERTKNGTNYISSQTFFFIGILLILLLFAYEIVVHH